MVKQWTDGPVPRGIIMDKNQLDAKVRSTIGWYNKQGKLQKPIQFSEVAQFLIHLEPKSALAIVCSLEGKEATISDPTAWICKAAKKYASQRMADGGMPMGGAFNVPGQGWGGGSGWGGGGSWGGSSGWGGGGGGGGWAAKQALDPAVRGAIGQYNKHPALQAPIQFDEVAPLLAQMSPDAAMTILASLEPKIAVITNPTAWISAAANRVIATGEMPQMQMAQMAQSWGGGGGGYQGGWNQGGGGGSGSVGQLIGQFNKSGKLQQVIQFDEVAPLLAQLEPSMATMIVKSLEGKEAAINNPTAWLANAARKYGAQ